MYLNSLFFCLGSIARGNAYMTWLGKTQTDVWDTLVSKALYLWLPIALFERWNNKNVCDVTNRRMVLIKKISIQVLIYPLAVICLHALFNGNGIASSVEMIYEKSGIFGFYKGIIFKLLIQMIIFIDKMFFSENTGGWFGRIIFWNVWQVISLPSLWLLERACLSSITGQNNLDGSFWSFVSFFLYLLLENPKSIIREIQINGRNTKFIGG